MTVELEKILNEFETNHFWNTAFKAPDNAAIEELENTFILPSDYKTLLSKTDGFSVFGSGDHSLYTARQVLNFTKANDLKKGVYIIGYFLGYSIIINSDDVSSNQYVYAGDAISYDEFVLIGSLTDYLNGFINVKGEQPFWNHSTPSPFYDFSN